MKFYSMEKSKDDDKFITVEIDCEKSEFEHLSVTGLFWEVSK
jgi:hypothetical protein